MSDAGYPVVDTGGTHVLNAQLKQFFAEEVDTYKSDVRLVVRLTTPGGKELWSGTTGGTATRFGRSYKAENYYEVLSDAVLEASYNLMKNPSFHAALGKR